MNRIEILEKLDYIANVMFIMYPDYNIVLDLNKDDNIIFKDGLRQDILSDPKCMDDILDGLFKFIYRSFINISFSFDCIEESFKKLGFYVKFINQDGGINSRQFAYPKKCNKHILSIFNRIDIASEVYIKVDEYSVLDIGFDFYIKNLLVPKAIALIIQNIKAFENKKMLSFLDHNGISHFEKDLEKMEIKK